MTEADRDAEIVQKLFPKPEDRDLLVMFCEQVRLIDGVEKVMAMEDDGDGAIVFAITKGEMGIPTAEEFKNVFNVRSILVEV